MRDENWNPGDVAMADGPGYKGIVFHHFDHESRSNEWMTAKEGGYYGIDLRPLVVIDPEDREQVERLTDLLWATNDEITASNDMQAALREFANPTPPKPEEPTGLGAVVEDVSGYLWVRAPKDGNSVQSEWVSSHSVAQFWDSIDVVKVLSEGVTP